MDDVVDLRTAILAAHLETSNFGETPEPGSVFFPLSHLKALRLDANVVVGGRGVGKSFWSSALQSIALRKRIGAVIPELDGVDIRIGFANNDCISDYPNADTFGTLLSVNFDPYDIWRAVIFRWVAKKMDVRIPSDSWADTVTWLKQDPEAAARLMQVPRSWRGLILFDALDRTSSDWQSMDEIVRGLLRAVLWLKSHAGLYAKVFLRDDQSERTVFNFPDASKILATKAILTWARHDLHGLLWQRLINAPDDHGAKMRLIAKIPSTLNEDIWVLPDELRRESESQKQAFERLAGPWMGRDKRRGVPYSWSVSHLADGRGQTSPRSFLAAIRQAVEDSLERYPAHEYALHFESIKRGIQKASKIRVSEIAEDYPWVNSVLAVLDGMNVPCESDLIEERWASFFPSGPIEINATGLPAQHLDKGWDGITEDLRRLGLIELKKDGRIDMPDLYRVGFGLGRRGGVKPDS